MNTKRLTLACATVLSATALHTLAAAQANVSEAPAAEDRAAIDRTRILGQRELPKVLTIVPWKKPLAGPAATRPLASVLDEALAPVDRDVLRRELNYHAQLRARATGTTAPPAER